MYNLVKERFNGAMNFLISIRVWSGIEECHSYVALAGVLVIFC